MKNFKKLFIVVLFLVVFVLGIKAPNVQAITAQELQVQIQALMNEIAELQKQLSEIDQEETPSSDWCHNFNTNLRYQNRGTEVEALQTALEKQGFSISENEKAENHFGSSTNSAMISFQERYANEILTSWGLRHGTGFVGGTTRAKLNQLYGCGVVSETCQNECSFSGQTQCAGSAHKQTCGNYDSDSCLEWSSIYVCVENLSCGYGTCSETQKPSWYCSAGNCLYNCVEDSSCESSFSCTDSDGGIDYYTKGITVQGDVQLQDECHEDNLLELFCTPQNTMDEMEYTFESIKDVIEKLRAMSPLKR